MIWLPNYQHSALASDLAQPASPLTMPCFPSDHRVDHCLLFGSTALSLEVITPLASRLITMNFHVCIPSLEARHPKTVCILGRGVFPKEGPECIPCFSIIPYPILDTRGPEDCWHERWNNVSKATSRSSRQENSSCHVQNMSSGPGTTTGPLTALS